MVQIIADIIKAHEGEIKVETKEGEGAELLFNCRQNLSVKLSKMKALIKKLLLILIFLLIASIHVTHAQDSRYDYDYDSLARQLNKPQTDSDRIKLLVLLVGLAPESGQSTVTEKTVDHLGQLVRYNKRAHFMDGAPYEVWLEGYVAWRKGALQEALADLKKVVE